jgi:dihydroorotate dehydrogenase (NAD+) catalytic subunit
MPRSFRRRRTRMIPAARRQSVGSTVRLGSLELPNPIVAASGTFGHGDEVARLCDPGELGAVTVKSLAPYEWPGNPAPRLHMTTAGMLNSVGLEGPGVEHWVTHELPGLRARGARVIASVWGRTVDDFALAAKMLHSARADLLAVEANVSCPNLEDRARIFAHAPGTTAAAVGAVAEAGLELPVFVKLSPNTTDLVDVAGAALGAGATGLTLINTVFGLLVDAERRRPRLGAGGGGLSGPAIKPVALRAVYDVARAYPDTPIIGTGGVTTGLDAVEMLMCGASAVGVGTATFHDPRAPLRILRELTRWCEEHGVSSVADLTGALARPVDDTDG